MRRGPVGSDWVPMGSDWVISHTEYYEAGNVACSTDAGLCDETRYHREMAVTVEPRYFFFMVPVLSRSLPWYRNTTNTAVLLYSACQQIVISEKIFG